MQAFEYYSNNIPTCGVVSTLKHGLESFPHQMLTDLIDTQNHVDSSSHFSSLKRVESHHFPYMANNPSRSPIWVTPVWWFTIPNKTKDELTPVCNDHNKQNRKPDVIQQTTLKWRTALKQGEFSLRTPSNSYSKVAESVWYICTTIIRGLQHWQTWINQIKPNVNRFTRYGPVSPC